MADRCQRHAVAGFTLVAMMLAIGILVFGVTSLVGLLSVGVSVRSTAELRNQAIWAADWLFTDYRRRLAVAPPPAGETPPPPPVVEYDAIPGYPRLRAVVRPIVAAAEPGLVLLEIRVSWLEQGAGVEEVFRRTAEVGVPFPVRVARARKPQ